MVNKKFRYTWLISWSVGFYLIQHNSLRIVAPCGLAVDIISALLIFLGVNKACYLLTEFYKWYKGDGNNADKMTEQ